MAIDVCIPRVWWLFGHTCTQLSKVLCRLGHCICIQLNDKTASGGVPNYDIHVHSAAVFGTVL